MKESKTKISSMKNKVKLFYLKNKTIIDGVAIASLGTAAVYFGVKSSEYYNDNNHLRNEVDYFKDGWESEKASHESDVLEKNARIDKLEDLCDEKDAAYLYLVSDAMRHGSSYGGFEMSRYKNEVKPFSD